MKKLLILTGLAMCFASCEDVVQVQLDEGAKMYVIDAFVNDLRVAQTVRVLANDNYFSNREAPPVSDAQVTITDLNTTRKFTFSYTGNGNYVWLPGSDTLAKANHQYSLEVVIGGVTYSSLAIQKRPAKIDSIVPRLAGGRGGFGPPAPDEVFRCRLFAKDKADNQPDYYWIKTFRNDTLLFGPTDINVSIDGTNGEVKDIPVDSTDFTEPIVLLGFTRFLRNDRCRVEIHSMTRENYYWFFQAAQQIQNGGLFATTPENVKTNIITPSGATYKATGRFNMASVSAMEIIIK
jgi:hypothetical protein